VELDIVIYHGSFEKWSLFHSRNSKLAFPSLILTILVFIVGVAVMSLEFSTSRLLLPVFGSSINTWGSLIGIILGGLSLGYYIGGRLADSQGASFVKFCSIIFSAGLYIVFIPFISPVVISSTSAVTINIPQYASLLAAFTLLIIPNFLLGAISPYSVKLATTTLNRLGNITGNLYSAATIGSICGTFLTVFVLIPAFEIRYIIWGLGLSLIIPSSFVVALFGRETREIGKARPPTIITAILPSILTGCIILLLYLTSTFLTISPIPYYSGTLVYQKETQYSHVDVVDSDNGKKRALFLDGIPHSLMNKDNPTELAAAYTKFFPIGFVFNPSAKNVLFVGGGGFSGPKYFLKNYPDVTVDVVEIDPGVIDVAKRYFNLNTSNSRLNIYNADARNFLSNTNQKYDIIFLDAFSKNYVPFHLMTLEYYRILSNKLTQDGVIVSNNYGSLDEKEHTSDLYRAVYKTMSKVFSAVYVFVVTGIATNIDNRVQNIILVATKNPDARYYSIDDIERQQQIQYQRILSYHEGTDKDYNHTKDNNMLRDIRYSEHLYDSAKIDTGDVPVLSDQFAPVENLLNPINSKPYLVEGGKNSINTKVDVNSTAGILLLFVMSASIAGIWIFYLVLTWIRTIKWRRNMIRKDHG
jgi:spermidine synthase